jgi:preprotein translocase subunit Sec61beta
VSSGLLRYFDKKQKKKENAITVLPIVIVTWGTPITAILIKNKELANAYKNNFEHLWKATKKKA